MVLTPIFKSYKGDPLSGASLTFDLLPQPPVNPVGQTFGTRSPHFSSDGKWWAVVTTTSAYVHCYRIVGSEFNKVTLPNTPPKVFSGRGIRFSHGSDWLFANIANQTQSDFVAIWKLVNGAWVGQPKPTQIPASEPVGYPKWSYADNYIGLGTNTSPNMFMYYKSGDTFSKLSDTNFSPQFTTGVRALSWWKDDSVLAMNINSPNNMLHVYDHDSGVGTARVFTEISGAVDANPNLCVPNCSEYSRDYKWLVVGGGSNATENNYINFYRVSSDGRDYTYEGDTPLDVKIPNSPSNNPINDISFSPNGKYMAIVTQQSPQLIIYKISADGESFTKIPDLSPMPTLVNGLGVNFSNDGEFLSVTGVSSAGVDDVYIYT